MGDSGSAAFFGELFDFLAAHPDMTVRELAIYLFGQTRGYDFSTVEMECTDSLVKLGVIRPIDEFDVGDYVICHDYEDDREESEGAVTKLEGDLATVNVRYGQMGEQVFRKNQLHRVVR